MDRREFSKSLVMKVKLVVDLLGGNFHARFPRKIGFKFVTTTSPNSSSLH